MMAFPIEIRVFLWYYLLAATVAYAALATRLRLAACLLSEAKKNSKTLLILETSHQWDEGA